MNLPALRSRIASGVTGVPGRLLFGLQRAFAFCAFGLGALGLNRGVAFRLLRAFRLAGILFRPFDLVGSLDRTTLGSARCSHRQPFCQRRVGSLRAKYFQRDLSRLGRGLLALDEIRLLKASHLFRPGISTLNLDLPWSAAS